VTQRKVCIKCEKEKDLTEFAKAKRNKDGHRGRCLDCWAEYSREYRQDNPGSLQKQAAASKRQREDAKRKVFEYYGVTCACCGESCLLFLTVEHIDGGGRKHRKTMGAQTIYVWLVNNGFPEGFEILCYNCNCGKRVNGGVCPHQDPE
jgi:hypothetical protein